MFPKFPCHTEIGLAQSLLPKKILYFLKRPMQIFPRRARSATMETRIIIK
jgi:hypothetical protein